MYNYLYGHFRSIIRQSWSLLFLFIALNRANAKHVFLSFLTLFCPTSFIRSFRWKSIRGKMMICSNLLSDIGFGSSSAMYSQSHFLSICILTAVCIRLTHWHSFDSASQTPFMFQSRTKDSVVSKKHYHKWGVKRYNRTENTYKHFELWSSPYLQ